MILVLGVLVALGPLTIDMYLPALPNIGEQLGVTSSVVQLTLTGTLAGLALGQLVVGPVSDALGRRRPLLAGIVLHMAASVLCALAPDIAVLGLARALQGAGAAAVSVVAIAVVGDLFTGSTAATVMSRLILVLGVAPVLAPSLGAAVLLYGSWQWVFAALVVIAGLLLVVAVLALPETLPPARRRSLAPAAVGRTYLELLRDGRFVGLVLVGALAMGGLFAYVAGAAFVLQGRFGLGQQVFAVLFGVGAFALIGATQYNVVLLRRFAPQRIALAGLLAAAVIGVAFVALTVADVGGVAGFVGPVWLMLAALGLVMPNAPALALARRPDAAGTAAALMGAGQFGAGALIAPLVGVLGNNAFAVAVVMAGGVFIGLVALTVAVRGAEFEAPATPEPAPSRTG